MQNELNPKKHFCLYERASRKKCFTAHTVQRNTHSIDSLLNLWAPVLLVSLVIGMSSPLAIPLPFSPIPIALQPHLVLIFAALLGSKKGCIATAGFLLQGILGLPVFACGSTGLIHLFGPRGGYLIGYVIAAFITGWIIEKKENKVFYALVIGNIIIYLCGGLQLFSFLSLQQVFYIGILPFLLGDFVKIIFFTKIYYFLKKYI